MRESEGICNINWTNTNRGRSLMKISTAAMLPKTKFIVIKKKAPFLLKLGIEIIGRIGGRGRGIRGKGIRGRWIQIIEDCSRKCSQY